MNATQAVSRRRFFGGVATAVGYLTLLPRAKLWPQGQNPAPRRPPMTVDEYDALAKLANNENPYGPPDSVLKAMTQAFKYANRYGYPDGDIVEEIAKLHGVKPENVMLGAGSGEILDIACTALLQNGRKVVGAEPSYDILYQHATGLKADQIKVPLLADFRQDIPATIAAVKANYRDVGFVYLCSPNNPTGRIVTRQEVAQLLNGIPEDVPVLIDEAYHHFVEDPAYATSVPYVLEGRQVIVTRTFSKIAALAGMRLGYGVAPRPLLQRMRPYGTGSINAVVKWGGVAALKDTASQAWVKKTTLELRGKTTAALQALGYTVVPSDANFFMVHLRRPVQPVVDEFRKKGVLVGRPFPALPEHLRISVGTADEMGRFMTAFKEIMQPGRAAGDSRSR
ncbi:MAG TPA: aminotransferase class I/II-fold pyridoxal phosphate-dependent enzyme [Gemmatimonadales bacterium]|jgi:histidinol-phosphate aminotransferase|nr:aminotransferase class I/II-fold pyridoxal phosphate-dependent enzyme [Gemmatimonadales bacterium]